MNLFLKTSSVAVITLTVSACGLFGGDERPVYQGAEYYKNLEVPPDLTEPDTGDQLRVPKPSDEALERFRDNNKLETVITPKFDGVRMVNYAGNSWLEIDNKVEFVWQELSRFWEREGIDIVEKRPLLGFMETDWTERKDPDSGYFKSLLQKFEPDVKDKFRVRVERFDEGRKTRLFVAHSSIERVVRGEYADEYTWQTLPSNLEAEREIIARMALYAGLTSEQSLALLENYRPYSSLVKIDRDDSTALTMNGSREFVWRRALRALDRMRMQEIREEPDNSTIRFVVGELTDKELDVEEDELAKSSWLMQLITGKGDEEIADDINRQYRLVFSEAEGRVRIQVLDARNSRTEDEGGDVSSTALAEQLRDILAEKLE